MRIARTRKGTLSEDLLSLVVAAIIIVMVVMALDWLHDNRRMSVVDKGAVNLLFPDER